MRFLAITFTSFVLSSCASTGIYTPPVFTLSPDQQCGSAGNSNCDPRFNSNYAKLKNLHDALRVDATALANEGNLFNGLSATAATTTLVFAGFDAHPDNILASVIAGGVSNAVTTQLKPIDRARLRIKGMSALTCIAGKADTFRDLTTQSDASINSALFSAGQSGVLSILHTNNLLQSYRTNTSTAYSSYELLDDLLYLFLGIAQQQPNPSDALKAIVPVAQQSRVKLALGIKAQDEAFGAMSDSIEAVRTAIEKEQPPSITALIDAISKVEIPKTPSAPSAGTSGSEQLMITSTGKILSNDDLAIILGFLSSKVDQLSPELQATAVRGMTACVAELSSS